MPNRVSKTFALLLTRAKDISLQDTAFKHDSAQVTSTAKYSLSYSVTLYNYKLRGTGGFYGRTLLTEPKPLKPSATTNGMLETSEAETIIFHTNYTEKTSVLVVELVIVREHNFQKVMASTGYSVCHIFDFTPQAIKQVSVQTGTPRQIGSLESDKAMLQTGRVGKTLLEFDIRE